MDSLLPPSSPPPESPLNDITPPSSPPETPQPPVSTLPPTTPSPEHDEYYGLLGEPSSVYSSPIHRGRRVTTRIPIKRKRDLSPVEEDEYERKRRKLDEAAARARVEEEARLSKALIAIGEAGYETLGQFITSLLSTKHAHHSSRVTKMLQSQGHTLLDQISTRIPISVMNWANEKVTEQHHIEARNLFKSFHHGQKSSVRELISDFSMISVMEKCTLVAPRLTSLLITLTRRSDEDTSAGCIEESARRRRDPTLVVVTALMMLAQTYGERFDEFQAIFGLYLLASGTARRLFDVLAHVGLTISYSSALQYLKTLSKQGLKKAVEVMHAVVCAIVWDNLNIAFRVGEQRLSSTDSFQNGTTATLIPLYGVQRGDLPIDLMPPRKTRRLTLEWESADTMPSTLEVIQLRHNTEFYIRKIILDWSETLHNKYRARLGEPPEVHQIPLHVTTQYPLAAMHIDESTLDGTLEVIDDILKKQLNMSEEDLMAHGTIIAHGDLLTGDLTEKVQGARRDDHTLSDSHRELQPAIGAFHGKMSGSRMTINEHWGTPNTKYVGSLWKENTLLGRKAMSAGWKTKKVPPFRPSHELIFLSTRAHILDAVRLLANTNSFDDWVNSKPTWEDICRISEHVVVEFASGHKVHKLRKVDDLLQRDICFENDILCNRDCLIYMVLVWAIKRGDTGLMWCVFSHWMVMMRGTGKMPKYADAFFKTRIFLKTAHPKLKKAFLDNWLINLTGHKDGFKEVDLLQEHHNFWAKVVYNAKGSNRSWEWLATVSVCIFELRDLMRKVQGMYGISSHGTHHTSPDDRKDINALLEYLKDNKVQSFVKNRPGNDEITPVRDLMVEGAKYPDSAGAFKNFRQEVRKGVNKGHSNQTTPFGEEEGDRNGEEVEEEEDGMDMEEFNCTSDDLAVDDEEFLEDIEAILELASAATDLE